MCHPAEITNYENIINKSISTYLFPLLCIHLIYQGKTFLVSDHCLQHAFSLHHSLCSSLLLAYKGLFDYFTTITKDLPSSHRMELGILHHHFTSIHQVADLRPVQFSSLALDLLLNVVRDASILHVTQYLNLIFKNCFYAFRVIWFLHWCFVAYYKFVVLSFHFTWSLPVTIFFPFKRLHNQHPLNRF